MQVLTPSSFREHIFVATTMACGCAVGLSAARNGLRISTGTVIAKQCGWKMMDY